MTAGLGAGSLDVAEQAAAAVVAVVSVRLKQHGGHSTTATVYQLVAGGALALHAGVSVRLKPHCSNSLAAAAAGVVVVIVVVRLPA